MDIPLSVILSVVGALAATIGILYKQNISQQKQVESLLSESKELMGSLAELIRSCNTLMVEVKDVINSHKRINNAERTDG